MKKLMHTLMVMVMIIVASFGQADGMTKYENELEYKLETQDSLLNKDHALKDFTLNEKNAQSDRLKINADLELLLGLKHAQGDCPDEGGTGSSICWDRCSREGYSSSICASRCGADTSDGSQSCWDQCSREGYSSSACASRCGTDTSSGSQRCWDRCSSEGYSSSACADRCGVETSAGSRTCWERCSSEGYSSSTCASRCGTN